VSSIEEQLAEAAQRIPEVFPDPDAGNHGRIADLAAEGVLLFYGRQPVQVGRRNIDWSGRHIKHQEWVAQLNRFLPLQALRRAYRQTGREHYAAAARDYIEDWIDQHPPYDPADSKAPQRDSSLNMAIRLGGMCFPGWLGVLADFMRSEAFDEAFAEKIVASVEWQLDWLERNLKPWGNWRIAALDSMFVNALRLPARFGRHLDFAVEGLNIAFETQILPDGVHIERSGGYHTWMCNVFVKLWRLGRSRVELGLTPEDAKVVRMHAYSLHHVKPNGARCGFNDCSGSFRPRQQDLDAFARRIEEHEQLLAETGKTDQPGRLAVFPEGGHVFYRTGWRPDDLWWAFDAIGCQQGGHTHLSRLSIELHNGGRTTLPDPGIFDYEMSNPLAPVGKATASHSTMNVNLGNQVTGGGSLIRAVDLPGAVVVHGSYEGSYWPGAFKWNFEDGLGRGWFGTHHRIVVWLKDRAMLVLDHMTHDPTDSAYLHWISDDVPVELDAESMTMTTADAEGNVRIQVCPGPGCKGIASIHRGRKEPYLGWVRSGSEVVPAPLFQVRFDGPPDRARPVATEAATVIAPFAGSDAPDFTVSLEVIDQLTREATIDWADGAKDRVIYTTRLEYGIRRCREVHTDAPMVLISTAPGDGQGRLDRVGGKFLRIG